MPPVSYILISINLPASSEADDCGVLLKMWSSLGFQPSLSPDFSLVLISQPYLMTPLSLSIFMLESPNFLFGPSDFSF